MPARGRLRTAIENFLKEFEFPELFNRVIRHVEESKELEFILLVDKMLDLLIDASRDIPELRDVFTATKQAKHQAGLAVVEGLASSLGSMALGSISSPILNAVNQELNKKFQRNILGPEAYIKLQLLGELNPEVFFDRLERHGLDPFEQNLLISTALKRLDAPDFLTLSRRGGPFAGEYLKAAQRSGWDGTSFEAMKELTLYYPSPGEVINWAVREAFNDEQARLLGLDQNYPRVAADYAVRGGMPEEFFKYAWRSHWQLPSLSQAYEMLHRLRPGTGGPTFTEQDFASLLVALDIAPVWHDRLKAISYYPITRVDLRRVYKAGLIEPDGLNDAYLSGGYNTENAELLTDWTIIDANENEREIAKTQIKKAVEYGLMTELEAELHLENLRLSESAINTTLAIWRFERKEKEVSAAIDYLVARFEADEIAEGELRSGLGNLGLSDHNIKTALNNILAKKKRKVKTISETKLEDLYENDMLSYDEMLVELKTKGYTDNRAILIARLIDVRTQEKRVKELNDAQKEQQRVAEQLAGDEKAVNIADLNVQIAELKAETADLKLIIPDLDTAEAQFVAMSRLEEIKRDIAYLSLTKAQVNAVHAKEIRSLSDATT